MLERIIADYRAMLHGHRGYAVSQREQVVRAGLAGA